MTNSPDISWCKKGGSRGYVTTQKVDWWIGKKGSGWLFTVPAGREFESSVPTLKWRGSPLKRFQPFHWVFSPDDPFFLKSAAIHDMLLEEGYRVAFADSQWFEAALSVHAPQGRTWLAFIAMRGRRFGKWLFGIDQLVD